MTAAPDRVLRGDTSIFESARPPSTRRAAEREFLAFPVEEHAPARLRPCSRERARPGDVLLLHRLVTLHHQLNAEHFGGALGEIPIRLSSRMRTRLGELAVEIRSGKAAGDHDQSAAPGPTPVARDRAHDAARDGAPVAGGKRAANRSWQNFPCEGKGGGCDTGCEKDALSGHAGKRLTWADLCTGS